MKSTITGAPRLSCLSNMYINMFISVEPPPSHRYQHFKVTNLLSSLTTLNTLPT